MTGLSWRAVQRGINFSVANAAVGGVLLATMGGGILYGLYLALGLSPVMIGIVSSVPMICLPLQIVGEQVQKRFFNRKKFWLTCGYSQCAACLALALTVFMWLSLPLVAAPFIFLVIYFFYCATTQLPAAIGFAWMGALLPPRESNSYWNRRFAFFSLVSSVLLVGTGKLVDVLGKHQIQPYLICILISAVAVYVMVLLQAQVPDIPEPAHKKQSVLLQMRIVLHNRDFRSLILFFAFMTLTLQLSCPFIFVYLQSESGMNYSMTTIQFLGALSGVIGFGSTYIFRIVGNRYGRKPLLILCTLLKACEFVGWAMMIPRFGTFFTIWVFILGGVVNIGFSSLQLSLLTSLGSRRIQGFSIGLFSMVTGFCGFIGSFCSGFLYEFLMPFCRDIPFAPFNILAALSCVSLVISVLFLLPLRENGAASARSVVRTIFMGNPIRNLYQAYAVEHPMTEEKRVDIWRRADGDLLTNSLLHDLYSPSGEVRESTLLSISRLRSTDVSSSLERELVRLLSASDLGCQPAAARALGELKSEKALPELIQNFRSPDVYLARASISAAGAIGNPAAVPELCRVLKSGGMSVVHSAAAESLGKLGATEHVRLIFPVMAAEHSAVLREQCLIALCRLTARDRSSVFEIFEIEEKNPGSMLGPLFREIAVLMEKAPPAEELFSLYDSGNRTGIMRIYLEILLEKYQISASEKNASFFDPSELFTGGGRLRNAVFNRPDRESSMLWLLMNLWAESAYNPKTPENLLLGFVFTLRELLNSGPDGNEV